jgi:hypothetical protein
MYTRSDWEIADTSYPAIRISMDEMHLQLDDEQLEDYLSEVMPGASPEDVENFMRSLQRFGRQVAPVAQRALPGIIQGAAQGGMAAGPWGALAGAIGGGAASLLSGGGRTPQQQPAARPPPARPTMPPPARPVTAPAAVPATAAAPGTPAIQQLLAMLSRPETMQALSALLLSGSGRSTVVVGNRAVPAAAFANAIAEIAAEVAETTSSSFADSLSEYLIDDYGEIRGDIVNPAERARLLLSDLFQVASEEFYDQPEFDDDDIEEVDMLESWDEEENMMDDDALDEYELALAGRG